MTRQYTTKSDPEAAKKKKENEPQPPRGVMRWFGLLHPFTSLAFQRRRRVAGPGRVSNYLQRYHEISIAASSANRLLCKHGVNRLPANQKHQPHRQRWKRYEKRQPGHRLQVDVKLLERIPGTRKRFHECTAIDDCTLIRVLKIYDACNQKTAIQFIDEVIRRLPFRVHVVQTDNGAEFRS